MEKITSKDGLTIDVQIGQAIKELGQPWIKAGLDLPQTSVIELSRLTRLPAVKVLNSIIEGKVVVNGTVPVQLAVIDSRLPITEISKAQWGPYYQKVAADIWSDGQRWQRRKQFLPQNTKGKTTRRRIEARVIEEQVRRTKVAFKPFLEEDPSEKRESIKQRLEVRWGKKSGQEIATSPIKLLVKTIQTEAKFPTQNLSNLELKIEQASKVGRPIRLGCFVCLVSNWTAVDGRPVYQVSADQEARSRLEMPIFVKRTQELYQALDKTGVPYEWTFLIADTDAGELFGDWSTGGQNISSAIGVFNDRIRRELGRSFEEPAKTKLWSEIQAVYQQQYRDDFQTVFDQCILMPKFVEVLGERVNYYRDWYKEYFFSRRMQVGASEIERLASIPPRRNIALYAAQGPIFAKEFDCLIVGDRDPERCGRNQSVLVKDLPIWYPYPGG